MVLHLAGRTSISRGSSFLNIITISLIVIPFASLVRCSTRFTTIQATEDLSSDLYGTDFLNRTSFPAGFLFGTASSSYQYEGAANESGRGPSIWDAYTHKYPGKITDGSNGDVAIDQYYRYKEDVGIMKEIGLDAYRFSISWSRILPQGKLSTGVNKEGIEYYNNLINELLANGINPSVTLFHLDIPQTLEDEYGGFPSPHVMKHFEAYAEFCYKEFGDRVKHWITFNEPIGFAVAGYGYGTMAPGRCSAWLNSNCTGGNSATEPYLVTHYQLLAHAAAVNLYKKHYQESQRGLIGIALVAEWLIPNSETQLNQIVSLRALDFIFGWYMDPLTNDFRDGVPIGPKAAPDDIYIFPREIRDFLLYTKIKYNNPLVYITENGVDEFNDPELILEEALADNQRIDYHFRHLYYLLASIKDGVNVKGYFFWSLLDDFEWTSGYIVRFGINYVDYKDGLKRYPKHSTLWFKNFLKKYDQNAGYFHKSS
ncbi:hypothetical protein M0R45_017888 [Rubus argutus]|uniref:Uncharacterized protein n=1 Tax=Rubus argutus TaxID=59490 RepID=A0AAW1XYY2_RUBAR